MRFDARIEVVCDECGNPVDWEPAFVYTSLAGTGGHYDTTDAAFAKWRESEGWTVDDDKDICPDCRAVREEQP